MDSDKATLLIKLPIQTLHHRLENNDLDS
jgi:hypothetical protein